MFRSNRACRAASFRTRPFGFRKQFSEKLADTGVLGATLKVPDAAGPISITADIRTAQIRTSIDVQVPLEGPLPRRVSWLTKQLKDAPETLIVEARFDPRAETTCEKLADVRERPATLIPGKEWEPTSFSVSQVSPMGTKRSGAHGSFVSTVTKKLGKFLHRGGGEHPSMDSTSTRNSPRWKQPPPHRPASQTRRLNPVEPDLPQLCRRQRAGPSAQTLVRRAPASTVDAHGRAVVGVTPNDQTISFRATARSWAPCGGR